MARGSGSEAPDALTLPLLPPPCPPFHPRPPFQTRTIPSPHKGSVGAGDSAVVAGEGEKKKASEMEIKGMFAKG